MYQHRLLVLSLLCVPAAPAIANDDVLQPAAPIQVDQSAPQTAGANRFEVGAIVLDNVIAMRRSDFADIVADYAGRSLAQDELAALSNRIAERARKRGYIFATATIAGQSLAAGVLRVTVEEGVIDEIRLIGADHPAIRAQLASLANGRPVTLKRLERQVLLADDVAGVRLGRPRYALDNGRRVLIVDATHDSFRGRVGLTNDGPRAIGPLRARIALDASALLFPYDEFEVTYTTTPASPNQLQRISVRYGLLVGGQGTKIALAASHSVVQPGAQLADRDINGEATRVSARLRHPLQRSRKLSIWLEGEAEWTELRQDRGGTLKRLERVAALRSGIYARARALGGFLSSRATLSQGLDILGASQRCNPLGYRNDASPDFTSLAGFVDWRRPLPGQFSIVMAAQGLIASGPLPLTEDMGLGGTRFIRGYNFNERSGDKGAAGLFELRYNLPEAIGPLDRFQVFGYGDAGTVGNFEQGRGSGSLASAGGGLRTRLAEVLDLGVMVAVPLTGDSEDSGDMRPRVLVNMGHSF